MKRIKNILYFLCLGLLMAACNSEEKEVVAATEMSNLRLQGNPGSIDLTWEYPEGINNNRYIEIRYYDPGKKKNVLKTISGSNTSFTLEDTRKKYGEYKFELQPFSTTLTAGNSQVTSGMSEASPATNTYISKELSITADAIHVEGLIDGTTGGLIDNDINTYINTNYNAPAGTIFYIDINYPKPQKFLKFSYVNRNNPLASFPAEIECYVKVNNGDEWVSVKTLTQAEDGLPTEVMAQFVSKEYEAPFEFNYFRFKVLRTHTGKVNFSMAEFRIYEVENYFYDPETEE